MAQDFSPPRASLDVPVKGGTLKVARWGGEGPIVLAPHGITANHCSWAYVAAALGDEVALLAPDLRGRGGSAQLPGPFGMATHADDLVAILDHLEVERAIVAGHSMGGFVATKAAARHPDRIESLVLIDGGLRLPVQLSDDQQLDDVLTAIIGPAMERLQRTFESRDAYRDYWRPHPALAERWNALIETYIDYDLHRTADGWQPRSSIEAVRQDGRDTLVDESLGTAVTDAQVPIEFLWAPRGIMNGDPLYPWELITDYEQSLPHFSAHGADDVNHYTVLLSPDGASQVAQLIRSTASRAPTATS